MVCHRLSDSALPADVLEEQRITELRNAQSKAEQFFREVEARGLIRTGISESQVNEDIYELAKEMYGISMYRHKKILRAGANTVLPYAENPPNHMIGEDDILFLDRGPVFEEYEPDFGRTFVIGSDPLKLKSREDAGRVFADGRRYFEEHPDIIANQLYTHAVSLAVRLGIWRPNRGPPEKIAGDKVTLYIHPDSHLRMRSLDEKCRKRHWILEIHFVDRDHQIGGFFEELLTVS
jgi:peptidase M24-like protein